MDNSASASWSDEYICTLTHNNMNTKKHNHVYVNLL